MQDFSLIKFKRTFRDYQQKVLDNAKRLYVPPNSQQAFLGERLTENGRRSCFLVIQKGFYRKAKRMYICKKGSQLLPDV